jgi:3-deoxy-7-phosphoheptulonate synthase
MADYMPVMKGTSDLRIRGLEPLPSPEELRRKLPTTERCADTVVSGREAIKAILRHEDERLLAVVGPCSIHDPKAALEYARRLHRLHVELRDRLLVLMRVYFEKPRTTIGWRGLIMDPRLDGSYDISGGLQIARKLLVDITAMGLPCGTEMLDPVVPQYIADLISWAAIGARTTESQTHRNMVSGLSMPVGFKNGTDGNLQIAIDAMSSARHPNSFIGIDEKGRTVVLQTTGNTDTHVILRGSRTGTNYRRPELIYAAELLREAGFDPALMVDCSHGNSERRTNQQPVVLTSALETRRSGRREVVGFMVESNLREGKQDIPADPAQLEYGVSVTDACVGWETTEEMLRIAVR